MPKPHDAMAGAPEPKALPKKKSEAEIMAQIVEYQQKCQGSLLYFTRVFHGLTTGRQFEIPSPPGRESHFVQISRALTKVFRGETKRLVINVPPRYGKTALAINFAAWGLCQYPDSNYIYVSYTHSLAKRQTQSIRDIIRLREYYDLFGVSLKGDSTAKDNFETMIGGNVFAVGTGGSITGRGAGIKNSDRFGGAIICDDLIKPDEASSDTVREGVNEWYFNTLQSRINNPDTPIIVIGQRVHEDDICARLIATGEYESLIIPAIDVAGNPLYPEMHDLPALRQLEKQSPYVFASQYQQNPQPAGGGIFKPEWFVLKDMEPDIVATFITADTAETDKDYNDATVFSFWGLYKVDIDGTVTEEYALHCIDCIEVRIEPKDLKDTFLQFYAKCMRHRVKPRMVAIEKKSTGTTLVSTLKTYQGIQVVDIERSRASGNKMQRFLEVQPYVAEGRVSLPEYGKHTHMFVEHMRKITANDTHAHDDIADTMADAVRIALIDRTIIFRHGVQTDTGKSAVVSGLYAGYNRAARARAKAYRMT